MTHRARQLLNQLKNDIFLKRLHQFEGTTSKILSMGMIVVIIAMVIDLGIVITRAILTTSPGDFLGQPIIDIFGFFLSILIALEILENITGYIRSHVVQVELVIATALTAVGRKIIILDLNRISGTTLIGLAIAIFSLAISYWIVRHSNRSQS